MVAEMRDRFHAQTVQLLLALKAGDPHLELPPVMTLLPQDSYDKPARSAIPRPMKFSSDAPRLPMLRRQTTRRKMPTTPTTPAATGKRAWFTFRDIGASHPSPPFRVKATAIWRCWYHAIQVTVVMRPESGHAIRVDVTQDGVLVARGDAGKDLRYDSGGSYVDVNAPRAYDILYNAKFGQHTLTLSPRSDGLGIYDIAFESCEVPGSSG